MLDHESYVALFNFGYAVVCLITMGVGVLVVRWSADVDTLFVRIRHTLPVLLLVLLACILGAKFYGPVACLYILGLYASFCVGIVLDIAESEPGKFSSAVGEFARESARQLGKLPTSH